MTEIEDDRDHAPHPIPYDALASHIAILGKTGAGKSFAARSTVERLLTAGGRVCVIDPTGVWFGLRLSRDGKKASRFPVVIAGGRHADVEIGPDSGAALARAVGKSSTPMIIDTSMMTVSARTKLFTGFAEAILVENEGPLHLVVDEAHLFAPQSRVPDPQSAMMLHAANSLVSLGRARGLRVMLLTQRPAKLHKDSLTQVETMIAMRLVAPQDRAAVGDWIGDQADKKRGAEILASLPGLPRGAAWIWAPEQDVLARVEFPMIDTFDSMAAPQAGARGVKLPAIDVTAVRRELQVVLSPPVERKPAGGAVARQASADEVADAEKRGYERGYGEGFVAGRTRMAEHAADGLARLAAEIASNAGGDPETVDRIKRDVDPAPKTKVSASHVGAPPAPKAESSRQPPINVAMSPTAGKILDVILRAAPMALGFSAAAKRAGASARSSQFRQYRREVEACPLVIATDDGRLRAADGAGKPDLAPGVDPIEAWASRLTPSYGQMLRAIGHANGALDRAQIAALASVSPTSSGLNAGLKELASLELVVKQPDGRFVVHPDLWSQP